MSIQTRTTALQNEIVRLYCYFYNDGILRNPLGQPVIEILDTDGVTTLDTIPAQQENQGIWYADWYVPQNLPLGDYYDRWSYQFDANYSVQEQTMIFSVFSLQSYINFLSKGRATGVSNRANQLMIDLANDFIYEAMHIPIYAEQGMRIRQDNQRKRSKSYYYFVVNEGAKAYEGDKYMNNGNSFTVFQTLPYSDYSSSSSSVSSSSSSVDSSSSSSIDSSSSSNYENSSSSSESDLGNSSSSSTSSSSTSEEFVTTTTTPYVHKIVLTCVGTGDPNISGVLTLMNGTGDKNISYIEYTKKNSTFSTVYGLAYENWNQDPRPIVRVNNRIADDGWHSDYMGKIYFDSLMAPEDSISVAYNFSYFSKEELLSFLNLGLKMMNGLPPASDAYSDLKFAPHLWDAGILLYAAITALKRLIFGLTWQEKRIIYGRPEDAQNAAQLYQDLYKSYMELWTEFGKNVKTRKLPGIALSVTPEYTLPGGRCMSADTLIKCKVDGELHEETIESLSSFFNNGSNIEVLSMVDGKLTMSNVDKIWHSGNKITYTLTAGDYSIRLSEEHMVYVPSTESYKPVKDLKIGDLLLVNNNGTLIEEPLLQNPLPHEVEIVYDIEVPDSENFFGNNILSHNSRWFRYLFKSGS